VLSTCLTLAVLAGFGLAGLKALRSGGSGEGASEGSGA
jgi:hypothetical protein